MARILQSDKIIEDYLSRADPMLKPIIKSCGQIKVSLADDYFYALSKSITGQQLSSKAARAIWNRILLLLQGSVSPEGVLSTSSSLFREAGLSESKTKYLKNLSNAVLDGHLCLNELDTLEDSEILARLTKIKGIGNWTAEMFLIFSLGRPDVFSLGDGGLQKAVIILYGINETACKEKIAQISSKWRPFRSFASLYLWRAIDNNLL